MRNIWLYIFRFSKHELQNRSPVFFSHGRNHYNDHKFCLHNAHRHTHDADRKTWIPHLDSKIKNEDMRMSISMQLFEHHDPPHCVIPALERRLMSRSQQVSKVLPTKLDGPARAGYVCVRENDGVEATVHMLSTGLSRRSCCFRFWRRSRLCKRGFACGRRRGQGCHGAGCQVAGCGRAAARARAAGLS